MSSSLKKCINKAGIISASKSILRALKILKLTSRVYLLSVYRQLILRLCVWFMYHLFIVYLQDPFSIFTVYFYCLWLLELYGDL